MTALKFTTLPHNWGLTNVEQGGMDGEIVTPLGLGMGHIMIEEATKVKRLPRNNLRADLSRSLLNNME
ncbi:MAG: hypothetical protein NT011_12620, partial [Kiritimatiellaeota bacterium]|nr:hypothetical protein [Kiritimatiellota bacterium]